MHRVSTIIFDHNKKPCLGEKQGFQRHYENKTTGC